MINLPKIDPRQVSQEIVEFLESKLIDKNSAVVGLSGGVDSTVTATLMAEACRNTGKQAIGLYIPSQVGGDESEELACEVATKLDLNYYVIPLGDLPLLMESKMLLPMSKYDRGNMTSRIRANIINTVAAQHNGLVVGTGNWDEDYSLGYYTLWGDGAVHCNPLGMLSKRHVRQLAKWWGWSPQIVQREATAELEDKQTDFYDLGYSYSFAELVIRGYTQGYVYDQGSYSLSKQPQVVCTGTLDKEEYDRRFPSKFRSVDEMVDDVLYRHLTIAKPKQRVPEVPEITLIYGEEHGRMD